MATTQKDRIMNISTPLGEDFLLINRFSASESLSELFTFEAELLHEETEAGTKPTIVDAAQILGQQVTVSIRQPDENNTTRTFSGIVNRFSQGNRDERFSYYYATIVPHAWLLTQNFQSRIFQHISVPQILKVVFEGIDVSWELLGTFEQRNYCVQYRESDFDFASRLMEEEGIYYYFEHSDGKHKMIVANTPQQHRVCPSKSDIPFFLEVTPEEGFVSSVQTWLQKFNLQTGKIELRDYNFQRPTHKLEVVQPSRFNIGGNQQLEVYDYPGGYARRFDGINKGGGEQESEVDKLFQDNKRTAQIRIQELDMRHITFEGTANCCSMTAGNRFNFINYPDRQFNGEHVLVSVRHEIDQSPTYISGEELPHPYTNSFDCISLGNPFRPLRKTPKPVVQGSQTAVVVGNAGEEIFTDKFGRVKVQFHWDREGKNDADSSCWIRVAKDFAGNKWGTMYTPRVGQEVIVDFLEGDPDQPIITGSVYNPATMPHYELPKFKTLSYIKTRTSPDDGKGFHEIRFEDKKDKEQVFIRSQKRMDVRVRGSYYKTVGGNRQEIIGVRQDNEPGGNLAITVGGNFDLHVKDGWYIGIDGKLNEYVKGDVVEDYQSNLQTQVRGKTELNAREITVEAFTKISFRVGASMVVIDLTGVTIQAPLVRINSGGFAMPTFPAIIDDPLDAETADTGEPGYLDRPRTGGGRRGRNRRTLNGQHAPPFQTTTLPNGDIQVGNGIVIRNDPNDPTFQQKVLRDLTTMSQHPTGMNTLNSLNNSGQTTTVQHTTVNGGNSYTPSNVAGALPNGTTFGSTTGNGSGSGGTVNYNPDFEPPTSADPSINRPADVGLHHELTHADHAAHGQYDIVTPDPSQPNNPHIEESNTIDRDNQYRDERGIPRRADHTVL